MGRAHANAVCLQTIIIVVNIAYIIVITSSLRCRISSSCPQPFRVEPAVMRFLTEDPSAPKRYSTSVWAFLLPCKDFKAE